ncbi:MAG: DUF3592 domain-containing protein [Verrucomicrobiota bacterium]
MPALLPYLKPNSFLVPFLGLGMLFLFWGGRAFWVHFTYNMNTEVAGKVITSKSETHTSGEKTRTVYRFKYRYSWQGISYTSKRYSYKNEGQRDAVIKHQAGETIQVFIDPQHPKHSIIVKGWSWLNLLWVLLGSALILAGLFLHISMTRDSLKKSNLEQQKLPPQP